MTQGRAPLISVIVEGHNAPLRYDAVDAVDGLMRQRFPLDRVELVMAGSSAQAAAWQARYAGALPVQAFKTVVAEHAGYVELKNAGAAAASGEILAFLDLDVKPSDGWLEAIAASIGAGADAVAGISGFVNAHGRGLDSLPMQIAASLSWGNTIHSMRADPACLTTSGFHAHSVAFRADVFRREVFRPGLDGRCAVSLHARALSDAGISIRLNPKMRIAHSFTWRWWSLTLHRRYGFETYLLRRLDPSWPHPWVKRTGWLEPALTMAWRMILDRGQWLRYAEAAGVGPWRRLMALPLVIVLSSVARGAEAAGMYEGLIAPERMRRLAASS